MTKSTVAVDEQYWNPMVPELSVTDLARSLVFYTGFLGFSVRYRRDDPPFAYLEQQQVQLMWSRYIRRVGRSGRWSHRS
ncbi:MAG: VOC family protein, partial [Aeromonas veronii]